MTDSTSAAGLLLKLYELRTEPTLRNARAGFNFEFHPSSSHVILRVWLGPGHESAPYRMVTTYWDMAASLVTQGAIPAAMFDAANTEQFGLYAKLGPFLADVRAATKYPDYLQHIERIVQTEPDPVGRIDIFGRYLDRQRTLAAEGKQSSYLTSNAP